MSGRLDSPVAVVGEGGGLEMRVSITCNETAEVSFSVSLYQVTLAHTLTTAEAPFFGDIFVCHRGTQTFSISATTAGGFHTGTAAAILDVSCADPTLVSCGSQSEPVVQLTHAFTLNQPTGQAFGESGLSAALNPSGLLHRNGSVTLPVSVVCPAGHDPSTIAEVTLTQNGASSQGLFAAGAACTPTAHWLVVTFPRTTGSFHRGSAFLSLGVFDSAGPPLVNGFAPSVSVWRQIQLM